jgi:hypothetical protein
MPIIQRRSRPVNGSVAALAVSLDGEVLELGVVVGVVFVSVVGDVPLFSFSVVVGVVFVSVVGVVALVSVVGVVAVFSSGFF